MGGGGCVNWGSQDSNKFLHINFKYQIRKYVTISEKKKFENIKSLISDSKSYLRG